MQPYIFRNASIIGIKILIAPLIFRTCCPFFIIPVIVDAKCYYIFLSILNVRSQVEADSHHAIFVQTDMMTIDISNITFTVENSMSDARDMASIAPSPASGIIFAGT